MTHEINIRNNITDLIGETPIVQFFDILVPNGKSLLLKLECFNPTLSVKDRTALGLIQHGLDTGKLKPGGTIIESTSGNIGKSLAMIGAVLGFKVIVVIDPKVSKFVLNWYRAYGARVELVTLQDETGGYQLSRLERVRELLESEPDAYWPDQYDNLANQNFHYSNTAKEFEKIDCDSVVGAIGTGGHLTGVGRYMKQTNKTMKIIGCDIEGSGIFFNGRYRAYLTSGVGLVSRVANTDTSVLDGVYIINDKEAFSMCRILAAEHGLLLGGSGGLVIIGALAWLNNSDSRRAIAVIPDSGISYLDQFYDNKWLEDRNISLMSRNQLKHSINNKLIQQINSSLSD